MRNPQRNIIRKEDLIYNPTQTIGDGFESGLSIAAGDRELAKQIFQAAADIQNSEDELRRTIVKQQNEVQLLNAKNKLSLINQEAFATLQLDPEQFKLVTNEQAADVISELPLLLRSQAKADFTQEQSGYYYRARNNQRVYLDKQKFEQLQIQNKNIAKFANNAIQNIVSGNTDADHVQGQIDLGLSIGQFESNLYERGGLNQELFDDQMKYEERQGFFGTLFETFAKYQLDALPPEQARDFIRQIEDGSAVINYQRLGAMFSIPSIILDSKNRLALSRSLKSKLDEKAKQEDINRRMYTLNLAAAGKILIDYKDKEYRDDVDLKYDQEVQPFIAAHANDPKAITNELCSFIDKYKTISPKTVSYLRSCMGSKDSTLTYIASDVIGYVTYNHGELLGFLPEADFGVAFDMNSLTFSGYSPVDALTRIQENRKNITEDIRKIRINEFNDSIKEGRDLDIDKIIDGSFLGFGKASKRPPEHMINIYKLQLARAARTEYANGASSVNAAFETARARLKSKNWGYTIVNGKEEMTLCPIENFYANEITPAQEIRPLILYYFQKQKAAGNFLNLTAKEIPLDDIIVEADVNTLMQAGTAVSKPTFVLKYKDEYGNYQPVISINKDSGSLTVLRIGKENVFSDNFIKEYMAFVSENTKNEKK